MKKIYCILLLFVILLTGTSCSDSIGESSVSSNEDSDLSIESSNVSAERELPKMLIADVNGYYIPEGAKSDFSIIDSSWKNEELIGTVIENPFGYNCTAPYDYNRGFDGFKFDHIFYTARDPYYTPVTINSETGYIIEFAIPSPICDIESEPVINITEAEAIAINFVKQQYKDIIDIDEYKLVKKNEMTYGDAPSYRLTWKKHTKDVATGRIIIDVLLDGEIVAFRYNERDQAEDKIPDYTKDDYLEACRIRLQEIYDEVGYEGYNDVKITSIEFYETVIAINTDFQSAYMRAIEKYCIECPVIYQFEYGDGQTSSGSARLYYPYAE